MAKRKLYFLANFVCTFSCWAQLYSIVAPVEVDFNERLGSVLGPPEDRRSIMVERVPGRDRSPGKTSASESIRLVKIDPEYFEKVAINIHYYDENGEIRFTKTAHVHRDLFNNADSFVEFSETPRYLSDEMIAAFLSPPEDCAGEIFNYSALDLSVLDEKDDDKDGDKLALLQEFYSKQFSGDEPLDLESLLRTPEGQALLVRVAHRAVFKDRPEIVKYLVEKGVAVDAKNDKGQTLLFAAAETKKLGALGALVSLGANPDLADERGRPPLANAISKGNIEVAEKLIPVADVNRPDASGRNALHMAADYGHSAGLIPRLLRRGADPNVWRTGRQRETALMIALRRGHLDAARALIPHSNVNAVERSSPRGHLGKTALFWAAEKGHAEIVDSLLEHGADPGIAYHAGIFLKEKTTPAEIARKNGHHEIAEKLDRIK